MNTIKLRITLKKNERFRSRDSYYRAAASKDDTVKESRLDSVMQMGALLAYRCRRTPKVVDRIIDKR